VNVLPWCHFAGTNPSGAGANVLPDWRWRRSTPSTGSAPGWPSRLPAEALAAEPQDDGVNEALELYGELIEVVRGRVAKATTASALNDALAGVIASPTSTSTPPTSPRTSASRCPKAPTVEIGQPHTDRAHPAPRPAQRAPAYGHRIRAACGPNYAFANTVRDVRVWPPGRRRVRFRFSRNISRGAKWCLIERARSRHDVAYVNL
jgi:hypothetical protein